MPNLADSITDGQLGKWNKQVGDFAPTDEIIVSIETDKTAQCVTRPLF